MHEDAATYERWTKSKSTRRKGGGKRNEDEGTKEGGLGKKVGVCYPTASLLSCSGSLTMVTPSVNTLLWKLIVHCRGSTACSHPLSSCFQILAFQSPPSFSFSFRLELGQKATSSTHCQTAYLQFFVAFVGDGDFGLVASRPSLYVPANHSCTWLLSLEIDSLQIPFHPKIRDFPFLEHRPMADQRQYIPESKSCTPLVSNVCYKAVERCLKVYSNSGILHIT